MPRLILAKFAGRARAALSGLGLLTDRGVWVIEGGLLACAFPRSTAALSALAERGVTVLINLHERRQHAPERLAPHGMTEVHLPVPDFAAPPPAVLDAGITAVRAAVAQGGRVAVHCGGGLGRTGTFAACYLLSRSPDLTPEEVVARLRRLRPGSVETKGQEEAVRAYAARVRRE